MIIRNINDDDIKDVDVDERVMRLIMTKNMCDLDFCGGRRS